MNEINKKEIIKKAARQLFFHFGLTKTSMEDIARQCNIAKPSIYYYYPSKEAIFNEVVIDEARRFINSIIQKIPATSSTAERIICFYKTYYEDLKKYSHKLAHLPESLYENYPHGRPIIKKISEILKEHLTPLIDQGIQDGSLQISDRDGAVSSLIVMTSFLNIEWILRHDDETSGRIFDNVIEIISNGIRRKNSNEN